MFWKQSQKPLVKNKLDEFSPVYSDQVDRSNIELPLSFLKRLIPLGQLSEHDLQQIKIELSQHKPGNIIFNRG